MGIQRAVSADSRGRLVTLVLLAVLAALAVAYLMARGVLPVVLAGLSG